MSRPAAFGMTLSALGVDVLMIPGDFGVRHLFDARGPESLATMLQYMQIINQKAGNICSLCTGAAILASAGELDTKTAAANHRAFNWVITFLLRVPPDNVA